MDFIQQPLDFDGEDPEIQLRMRWAENRRRDREFWTPERLTLSWMQGTTPDESDMAWWNLQPKYKQREWLDFHQRERDRMRREKSPRRPFAEAWAEWEAILAEAKVRDEAQISRYMDILREDFLAGRPCSISLETADPSIRRRLESLLKQALHRLSIPSQCLTSQAPPLPSKSRAGRAKSRFSANDPAKAGT